MMQRRALFLAFVLGLFLFAQRSDAFPELVRHGYTNCITCHVSQTGGGVLTAYGRALSEEVLSTWTRPNESAFAYGAIKPPEWLLLGGDLRAVQTYENTPTLEQGRFLFMQADVEGAATLGPFQAAVTIGRQEPSSLFSNNATIIARRFYATYKYDDEFSIRVGKFYPAYGLNIADHVFVSRRRLGFDEGSETYNAELAWLGKDFEVILTGTIGNPAFPTLHKGVMVRGAANLGDRYKLGVSYFTSGNATSQREATGPFAILGITPKFFITADLSFVYSAPNGQATTWGVLDYVRVNYELVKGVIVFGTQELALTDFNNATTQFQAYGLGAQWFPRPHIELEGLWQKKKTNTPGSAFTDYAWLLLHYYL